MVAEVPSWLNWRARLVWVIRAVRLISGDVAAVARRTLTVTMSPAAAPAQNSHAVPGVVLASFAEASTVMDWTRFRGAA